MVGSVNLFRVLWVRFGGVSYLVGGGLGCSGLFDFVRCCSVLFGAVQCGRGLVGANWVCAAWEVVRGRAGASCERALVGNSGVLRCEGGLGLGPLFRPGAGSKSSLGRRILGAGGGRWVRAWEVARGRFPLGGGNDEKRGRRE